ncbi:mfs nicotinic acid transporter tna1 [Moniliophthora roreri]|nr:mfs nicotinic acid transporter tna1 [Moniliophthora roreri]
MHDQIRYMELQRIQENGDHKIDAKGIYLLGLMHCSSTVPSYALKFSMPTIIKGMGFTSANAQLMTIGPYSIGAISSYIFGRFSDKVIWRMPLY